MLTAVLHDFSKALYHVDFIDTLKQPPMGAVLLYKFFILFILFKIWYNQVKFLKEMIDGSMMNNIDFDKLYIMACEVTNPRKLSEDASCGTVGAVLLCESGNIYKGVCIDTMSSMGFCAEHSAAAAMITAGESRVVAMVSVNSSGEIYYPCGRCRQFITVLNDENKNALVLIEKSRTATLKELLPTSI